MRASHADRERAVSALKTAFVQGRLVKDEFDARVGRALASRTHAELAAITADIPVDPAGAGVEPARARAPQARGAMSAARVSAVSALLAAVLWTAGWFTYSAAAMAAAVLFTGVVIFTLFVAGDQLRESRQRKRPARPLPPGALPQP